MIKNDNVEFNLVLSLIVGVIIYFTTKSCYPCNTSNTINLFSKLLPAFDTFSINKMANSIDEKFKVPGRYGQGEESVWNEFNELAAQTKPLNLGQGCPDFAPPKHVTDALAEVANSENVLLQQYARGYGHVRLINSLAKLYTKMTGHELNPQTEILITGGAYGALFSAIYGHVDEGDEVIIIEPFFDCYEPMVRSAGGIPIFIPLRQKKSSQSGVNSSGDFVLDKAELEALFNNKTKAIILNTPNNPLGKVFEHEELEIIADLCKKWNVLCISDEVYEWLVYKPYKHIRIATLPDMWERTITIGSAGKTFSVTGWKIGWAYGPENLMRNLQTVHQNSVYTCPTPIQEALAMSFEKELALMDSKECYFYSLAAKLLAKRDYMIKFLSEGGMKPIAPEGGYFIIADWSPLAGKVDLSTETDKYKDYRMAKWMTKNLGLLGIPSSAFYSEAHKDLAEDFIRYCFIKEDDKLQQAAAIFKKFK